MDAGELGDEPVESVADALGVLRSDRRGDADAGPAMSYQPLSSSLRAADDIPASSGWTSCRTTLNGTACADSLPRAKSTVHPQLSVAYRRISVSKAVLPRPASPL